MRQWWLNNGFKPQALASTDILTGLQSGLIEALAIPPLVANAFQWYRKAPYMHELGLAPLIAATVITRKTWSRIPEEYRPALLRAAHRAEDKLKAQIPDQEHVAIEQMKKRGLEVTQSTDAAEWKREADRFADSMRGHMVPEEIFDRARDARDAFRTLQTESKSP